MMRTTRLSGLPAAILTATILSAVLVPAAALADGGFMPPYGIDIYEPAQTAFIRYDSATSTETLSIMPRFSGEPTDFAWVVPVPALPEVTEADQEVFRQLSIISQPLYRSRDSFWNCEERVDYALGPPRDGSGVEIIGEDLIGIYRTMVLGAGDAEALIDSLTAWGFLHAGNLETVTPLLQDYVDDGWYFVTMTIDSTAVAGAGWPYGKVEKDVVAPYFYYPSLQPITFTFASDEIIYPLRISRISAYGDNAVTLYVAADHRLTFPSAQTLYGNRITSGEFDAMGRQFPQAGAELWNGAFLTKLYRSYTALEMDEDIVLERAPDDQEFLPVSYSGLPVWTVVFSGSVLWWMVRRRRLRPRGPVTPAS